MKKLILSVFALCFALSASAIKVYINPGHGSWGANCRPMATINYAAGDTLGFFESNTNLWKSFILEEKLLGAGYSVKMSRRASGGDINDPTYNKGLSTISSEANNYGADYFISIHSNAGPEGELGGASGKFANYPVIIYKGTTGSPSVKNSDKMSSASIARLYEAFWTKPASPTGGGGPEPTTYWSPSNPRIVGDYSFYGYHLGVLKNNSCQGFLSEGYFHTYSPARHRALNPEWCRQEGIRYFRGIQDYYGKSGETVGYIMGYVRSKTEKFSHKYYIPLTGSNDEYLPLNGAKIVLRNAANEVIKTNCYNYVKRKLSNQDYYTTDHNYNGVFVFENLKPGKYTLYVHKSGYKDVVKEVTVTADKTLYPEIFMEKGAGTEPNVSPADPDIIWELNGGKVLGGEVPTNEQLWEEFKPYYNSYYGLSRATQTIENVATFANAYMEDIMTNTKSEYKWLGDYIISVAGSLSGESAWRWHVHAFFNCNDGTVSGNQKVATADFSQAGKPEAWGPAYQTAMGTSATLPYKVTSTYTLPTPVKEGYIFVGWYDNPEGAGTALISIPAGWKGTLYAIWRPADPSDVTWVLNGGNVGNIQLPEEITGSPYTLPTPTRTGYVFLGWYDNPNGTGTPLTVLPVGWKGTVYAKWREAKITWVLNGGKVLEQVTTNDGSVTTPTNEELFSTFMNDYNAYYESSIDIGAYSVSKGNVANFLYHGKTNYSVDVTTILTDTKSTWKWLGDYIQEVTVSSGAAAIESEVNWRFSLAAFFQCGPSTDYCVDFTEAGKQSAWESAYQAEFGKTTTQWQEVTLPTKITGTAYTIPTPTKDNDVFVGWYNNNEGMGTALTVLPIGYDGTVYAIWESMTTPPASLEQAERPILDVNAPMYDILGRRVDASYCGIVIQNGNKYILK